MDGSNQMGKPSEQTQNALMPMVSQRTSLQVPQQQALPMRSTVQPLQVYIQSSLHPSLQSPGKPRVQSAQQTFTQSSSQPSSQSQRQASAQSSVDSGVQSVRQYVRAPLRSYAPSPLQSQRSQWGQWPQQVQYQAFPPGEMVADFGEVLEPSSEPPPPYSFSSFALWNDYMRLWRLFPHIDRRRLHNVLACSGNFVRAVDSILFAQSMQDINSRPMPNRGAPTAPPIALRGPMAPFPMPPCNPTSSAAYSFVDERAPAAMQPASSSAAPPPPVALPAPVAPPPAFAGDVSSPPGLPLSPSLPPSQSQSPCPSLSGDDTPSPEEPSSPCYPRRGRGRGRGRARGRGRGGPRGRGRGGCVSRRRGVSRSPPPRSPPPRPRPLLPAPPRAGRCVAWPASRAALATGSPSGGVLLSTRISSALPTNSPASSSSSGVHSDSPPSDEILEIANGTDTKVETNEEFDWDKLFRTNTQLFNTLNNSSIGGLIDFVSSSQTAESVNTSEFTENTSQTTIMMSQQSSVSLNNEQNQVIDSSNNTDNDTPATVSVNETYIMKDNSKVSDITMIINKVQNPDDFKTFMNNAGTDILLHNIDLTNYESEDFTSIALQTVETSEQLLIDAADDDKKITIL